MRPDPTCQDLLGEMQENEEDGEGWKHLSSDWDAGLSLRAWERVGQTERAEEAS